MDPPKKGERPMLSSALGHPNDRCDSLNRDFSSNTRSLAMPIPVGSLASPEHEAQNSFVRMCGPLCTIPNREVLAKSPENALLLKGSELKTESTIENSDWVVDDYMAKNKNLRKSGQLGMCNDPYCTTCPTYFNSQDTLLLKQLRRSEYLQSKFHNVLLYSGAKGWTKKISGFLHSCIPGIMNPHARVVQQWTKFFLVSCLFAVFLDPLFFFLLSVQKDKRCIVLSKPMTYALLWLRSMTDFVYFLHMVLQFRLAYVAPESRVMGSGDLIDDPKKIARNYLSGYFIIDLFDVLPLPQMITLLLLRSGGANDTKNFLRAAILIQYIPRLCRFLPLLAGQSPTGFVFESAWANFVINLLTYILASHVIGSCWYLFGLQRVNQCLRNACRDSKIESCTKFIDCGHGDDRNFMVYPSWSQWKSNNDADACFGQTSFAYGIYEKAVALTIHENVLTRYVYSLVWGFQQISTLAGNQVPSYFVWEVLFTMSITGIGLLLFALLIGNMQNFLQALGRRRLEQSLRRRDVERWMKHRRLPEELRRQVRDAERYSWVATRGINEEMLMENLPEDLQTDIRRHLFKFVKKVRILQMLDVPIVDAISLKLRTKTYIKGSKILYHGGVVDKMVFIIRGKMKSTVEDDMNVVPLCEGDVCGEELLTWCLEPSAAYIDWRIRIPRQRLLSNREVVCLTNVEAFVLHAADIEEVTCLFAKLLGNNRVRRAIRYESPYWRALAARQIQVAWRERKKKRLSRPDSSSRPFNRPYRN